MYLEVFLTDQALTACWTFVLAGIAEIRLSKEVRIVFDLIFEWILIGTIMIAMVYLMALVVYATIALIRMAKEELKK